VRHIEGLKMASPPKIDVNFSDDLIRAKRREPSRYRKSSQSFDYLEMGKQYLKLDNINCAKECF
jgi:hypothetical protein